MSLSKPMTVSYFGGKSSTALEFYNKIKKNKKLSVLFKDLFMTIFILLVAIFLMSK